MSSDSDDDKPLLAQTKTNGVPNGKPIRNSPDSSELGDDNAPLAKRVNPSTSRKRKPAIESSPAQSEDDTPLAKAPPKASTKRSSVTDSDDDMPLARATKPKANGVTNGHDKGGNGASGSKAKNGKATVKKESDSEGDVPLAKSKSSGKANGVTKKAPAKKGKAKKEEDSDHDMDVDDDYEDSPKKKPPTKKRKVAASSDGEKGTPVKKAKKEVVKAKKEPKKSVSKSPTKKGKKEVKDEEEADEAEEEEQFKWWEKGLLGDGSQKWETLEHNGVLFPPPYEALPKDIKLLYNGKPVELSAEAEEVAGFFGAMLATDHAQDEVFQKNFFDAFLAVLKEHPPKDGTKIKQFGKCDFRVMADHFEAERAKKKSIPNAEKKAIKAAKDALEEPYKTCLLDGRQETVGNFRAEPPGLFRGRGKHPKKGALKLRLRPEDITINIGAGAKVPVPNIPGKWKKVTHDNTVTWLATWKENVNGNTKYVFLAAGSSLKGQSDMMKFEKARELKNHVERIRVDYTSQLKSKVTEERMRATAMYLIDKLALRAGNEKGDDEADTVGCCSLRYEHVTLQPPNELVFDFLGKDSIRYYNVVAVDQQVFKNIRIFKGDGKAEGDAIFDRVTTSSLNKHLQSYMKGLTAKVFRTYNASITFQEQLDKYTPKDGSIHEKLAAYNEANRMVAKLCNHQRAVPKSHGASMEKMANQIRALKYQRRKLRLGLLTTNPKLKKKHDVLAEEESDIDDEWIEKYEDETKDKDIEKAKKKFEKDNEKRAAEDEELLDQEVLDKKVEDINEEYERVKAERGTGKAELTGKRSEEALIAAVEKLDDRIKTAKLQMVDRDKGKEVSLTTSKINYLDPRITTAWCKTHDVPIEKMFSKVLIVKFPWAMEVDEDWKF